MPEIVKKERAKSWFDRITPEVLAGFRPEPESNLSNTLPLAHQHPATNDMYDIAERTKRK